MDSSAVRFETTAVATEQPEGLTSARGRCSGAGPVARAALHFSFGNCGWRCVVACMATSMIQSGPVASRAGRRFRSIRGVALLAVLLALVPVPSCNRDRSDEVAAARQMEEEEAARTATLRKEEAAARAELEGLNSRMASLKAELSAAGKGQRTGDAATLPNKIAEFTALKAEVAALKRRMATTKPGGN